MKSFLAGFLFVLFLTGIVGGLWYTKNTQKSNAVVQEKVVVKTAAPTVVVQKTLVPLATAEVVASAPASAKASAGKPADKAVDKLVINFSKQGSLVKEENSWKILYGEPGNPAVVVNLKFDNNSKCDAGLCDASKFIEGTNVDVLGNITGDVLTVVTMDGG